MDEPVFRLIVWLRIETIDRSAMNFNGAFAITNGNIKLDALASPVMVRQTDDRQVELYLNYTLAITAEK